MTLVERIAALATAIANHIRDSITPRLVPPGGTTGQVLAKTSGTDFVLGWATPSGGGGGGGTAHDILVTIPNGGGRYEHVETVALAGVSSGQRVMVSLAPVTDADENDPSLLDVSSLSARAGADAVTVTLAFATPVSGPVTLLCVVN